MHGGSYYNLALKDIVQGFSKWQLAWLLGIGDIKQRYARSKLGQFWITLSMLIFIVAIGVVYSFLFHQEIKSFLPYVACNYVAWTWLSTSIIESSTVFVQAQGYIKQTPIPRSIFALRTIIRNFVNFLHNIIIIFLVFVCMLHPISWNMFLVIPGIFFILCCGFFSSLCLGVICTRFRDLPQIVQAIMQILMFLTPVMWPVSSLSKNALAIVEYNPMAALMHVVSKPFLGIVPDMSDYILSSITLLVLMIGSGYIFARFRARIVYWL
ncbi:ABC transporter permease [Acetobacter orientalis]|uniref:Transport permease protein n=1 Tax=Acetobacter orientalis TaxID=146474 RepID=A0A0D6NI38_9PROT|nr:ABC transporter permease [Acetobacter orientalis]MCP1220320.1 ABC transporter permease [Acetobacter orientalis]GAN65275.1 ABC transporter polysaccharide/O-antigene exporter [Acetobacter orientalis]GBR14777.1 polysaccharide/O-antigen exporter permease [Acetobacter orientalis NRIC 0481]GEL62271.1 sugar ABC transporter permease [Acetobacter orientalis]